MTRSVPGPTRDGVRAIPRPDRPRLRPGGASLTQRDQRIGADLDEGQVPTASQLLALRLSLSPSRSDRGVWARHLASSPGIVDADEQDVRSDLMRGPPSAPSRRISHDVLPKITRPEAQNPPTAALSRRRSGPTFRSNRPISKSRDAALALAPPTPRACPEVHHEASSRSPPPCRPCRLCLVSFDRDVGRLPEGGRGRPEESEGPHPPP